MHTHPPHLRDERLAWLAVEPALRRGFWGRLFGRGHDRSTAVSTDNGADFDASTITPDLPGVSIGTSGGQPVPSFDDGDRFEPPHRHHGVDVPTAVEEEPFGRPDVDSDAFLDTAASSPAAVAADLRPGATYGQPDATPLSRKMQRYSVAVDRVVGRLSHEERGRLRETGQVPDWFLGAVRKEAKAVHF
jgi:hypothetical protein